ncbi:MAG: ATP-binding protein [Chloroflexota bacterium]
MSSQPLDVLCPYCQTPIGPNDAPDQPILARGDAQKLSWVLLQLIDNAIKAVPKGGVVTLRLNPDADRRTVTVAVQDNGIGIPAERIPRLFQPLPQSRESTSGGFSGTGLGLVMARRIVEAHESKIHVESIEGRGSTFSFELPLAAQQQHGS